MARRLSAVPAKWKHLRPQTQELLRSLNFHDPRENEYGSLAPMEQGLTGQICTSIAFRLESVDEAAKIFSGEKLGYVYSRVSKGTPPGSELSERLLDLELGKRNPARDDYDVLLTASGSSAIKLLVEELASGEDKREFISSPYLYGGTSRLFLEFMPRFRIYCRMIQDPLDLSEWKQAASDNPRASFLFAEDDANPTPIKLDNRAIAEIAHKYGKLYVCDRTIGTPVLERPLTMGTDIVIHSASKNLGGMSRGLGGVIIGRREIINSIRGGWSAVDGPVMDARVADYILYGTRTLEKRLRIKIKNAKAVAAFLKGHPKVKKVYGPAGDLLSFDIYGTAGDTARIVESVRLIIFAPHLGDLRTLIIPPALTTHFHVPIEVRKKLGIHDTLIRVAVGLEDHRDLIDDLEQALG